MKKFDSLMCTIMSKPLVEAEKPFYMSFHVKIQEDVVPAIFIGNAARAQQHSIHVDDTAVIKDAILDNGKLVFGCMYIEPNTNIGKNINVWG